MVQAFLVTKKPAKIMASQSDKEIKIKCRMNLLSS